jgi:prolipoprotein diacylglyceryl transferase
MQWVYQREGKDIKQLDRLLYYMFAGAVIGARLGHCFFYEPEYYLANPLEILYIWKGGLASHGGTVGMLIACALFQKHTQEPFLYFVDRLTLPISLGSMFIRLGNFFNSEILGQQTDGWYGIVFAARDNIPRHPAQLYESAAYLFTFILLFYIYKTKVTRFANGFMTGVMFLSIFSLRFLIEFIKREEANYTLPIPLHVGHILSIPFIILGLYLIFKSIRNTKAKH